VSLQVIDDAIPQELYMECVDWLKNVAMLHGWRATGNAPGSFWHRNFVLDGSFKNHYTPDAVSQTLRHQDLMAQDIPLAPIARLISDKYFGGLAFSRVWINAQNFGDESAVHRDFEREYDATSRAAIWYPVQEWNENWGGDFAVFNDDGEINGAVAVKPNRLVVMNGNLRHAARPMSRFCTKLRISVAFGREIVR